MAKFTLTIMASLPACKSTWDISSLATLVLAVDSLTSPLLTVVFLSFAGALSQQFSSGLGLRQA